MRNSILWATALGGVLLLGGGAVGAGYSPRVGTLHGDFTLPNIETGEPVSLSQFRGKKVLLIHFASW